MSYVYNISIKNIKNSSLFFYNIYLSSPLEILKLICCISKNVYLYFLSFFEVSF